MFQIATGFYGTQFLINHSGSDIAKLAVETNSQCLSLNVSSESYANCTYRLEKLVKNLTDSGEIQVENCELDEPGNHIAYCPVWVWYFPQWLPLTDVTIVGVVGGRTDRETISSSSKLEKILSKLTDASNQLTDLSHQGRDYHFNGLEKSLFLNSGASQQLSDLSDRGKDGLPSDEIAQIFSTILEASQDLTDELDKRKKVVSDDDDNIPSTLSSKSYYLRDTQNDIIPKEVKQIASQALSTALQLPENEIGNLNINSLQTITNNLNLDNFQLPLSNSELLQELLQFINPTDIENLFTQSNLMETLTHNLNTEDLEEVIKSLLPNLGIENSFNTLSLVNVFFQYLDTQDVVDFLDKTGLIETLVEHLENIYFDEVYEKSEIEKAMAHNLKTNHFFENTLKSAIIDTLVQNLYSNDDKASFEKFGLLLLLTSSMKVNGLGGPLDESGLIKIFLENIVADNTQDSLGKSDFTGILTHNLESSFVGEFHHKSDLEEALVENLKRNQYIDHAKKLSLNDELEQKPESKEKQNSNGKSNLNESSQDLELKDSLFSLDILKFLAPSLDSNVLENPINKLSLLKSLVKNIDVGDVENFLHKTGFIESLTHLETNNHEEKGDTITKDESTDLNHNHEHSLLSYLLKGLASNPDTTTETSSSGLLQTLTTNLESNYLKDYHLPGKLDLVQSIAENINTNNYLDNSLNTGLVNKILPHQEKSENTFNILDLINMYAKNGNLPQNGQQNTDEIEFNQQTAQEKITEQEHNDNYSSPLEVSDY